jgi:nitrate reductase delta subunit
VTPSLTDRERMIAWQTQSLLLDYPDDELRERLPLLRAAAEALPEAVGAPLVAFCAHVDTTPAGTLTADYVATFDHRKRFSLFLTYFRYGDTRKRGMALLRFQQAYRAAGHRIAATELPDHLAVVLEFAATVDSAAGLRLLSEYRASLELLRLGLRDWRSPWCPVLESVSATLPPLGRRDREVVEQLAASGPPEEDVGLDPYPTIRTPTKGASA